MDQRFVPQPAGSGAGEREAFGGVRDRRRQLSGTKTLQIKINFDKTEGLQLSAWKGGVPCQNPSAGVTDSSVSSGYGSESATSWSEIGWSRSAGEYLASKAVVLKK